MHSLKIEEQIFIIRIGIINNTVRLCLVLTTSSSCLSLFVKAAISFRLRLVSGMATKLSDGRLYAMVSVFIEEISGKRSEYDANNHREYLL